jgi:thiol-disulfide isomerase/thioredoxin
MNRNIVILFFLLFEISFAKAQVRFPSEMKADLNFILTDLHGKKYSMQQHFGKVIIIHQWATWCGPCKKEEPALQSFYKEYKNEVAFFMLSDESVKRIRLYKEKHQIDLPYYMVKGGMNTLPKMYYSETIPVSYVISKNGEIRMIANGVLDWQSEALQKFIEKLLDE